MALVDDIKGLDIASWQEPGPFGNLAPEDVGGLEFASWQSPGPFYAPSGGGGAPPAEPGTTTRVFPGLVRVFPGVVRVFPL